MFETVDCSRKEVLVFEFLDSEASSLPRTAPVFSSAMEGLRSYVLGRLLIASLSGF